MLESRIVFPGDPRKAGGHPLEDSDRHAQKWFAEFNASIANINLSPNAKILELGSGKGSLLALLRREGFDAVGVDSRPRGNADGLMVKARIEQLPFPEKSFDAIVSVMAFQKNAYEQDQNMMIDEICRVLKPNGVYVHMGEEISYPSDKLKLLTSRNGVECHVFQKL